MASRARSRRRSSSSTARATTLLSRSPAQTRPARSPHQDPIKWQEAKLAARFDDLPAALMHEAMVVVAEQDQVGQVARSTSRPVNDVVRARPVDRAIATWEPAALVSNTYCAARRRCT